MKFSTRTRYGLRLLVYLGANFDRGYIQLSEIARNEGVSMKYLEQIVRILKPKGLISVARGAKGGYALAVDPKKLTLDLIFELLEGRIEPVECLYKKEVCPKKNMCSTYDVWKGLSTVLHEYLADITLYRLVQDYLGKHDKGTVYAI